MTTPDLTHCKQDPTLLDRPAIQTDHGQLMAIFGLGAELYVAPRGASKLRSDMIQVQRDYFRRFGCQLDRVVIDSPKGDSRIVKLEDGAPLRFDHAGDDWPTDQAFTSVVFKHYTHPGYPRYAGTVSPYVSDFLAIPEADAELSFYECYLPVASPSGQTQFDTLLECVRHWAGILRPAHGGAGYCVVTELATLTAQKYAYATLQRYPGLDIHDPGAFGRNSRGVYDKIKCINWLTVLGDEIVAQLGGIHAARRALEPDCILHSYEGGIVVQAGNAPQLGDSYQGDIPAAYRKVARFTKSVRLQAYRSSLFRVFEPMDGKEEAVRWTSRFD